MSENLEKHRDEREKLMDQHRSLEERIWRLHGVKAASKGILRRELYRAIPVS